MTLVCSYMTSIQFIQISYSSYILFSLSKGDKRMQGKTHLVFGMCTGITTACLVNDFNITEKIIFASVCIISSIFPDIDIQSSMIGKKVKLISATINKMFGHRGFIHSPLFFSFLYLILFTSQKSLMFKMPWAAIMGAGLGFFGHLVLDTATKGGVPWLYPFSKKKYHITNVKTGCDLEPVLAMFFLFLYMMIFINSSAIKMYLINICISITATL